MVKGLTFPIYSGKRAHQSSYSHIQSYVSRDVSREGGGATIRVSRAVAEAVAPKSWSSNGNAHNIDQIRWEGITYRDINAHEDRDLALPGINYFSPINGTTHRLLLLDKELVELAKYFGVPPKVLKDANFVYDPSKIFCLSEAWLQPRWIELVDPKWKAKLLGWIAGRNGLPHPNSIPKWKSWPNGLIGIAGLPQLKDFSPGKNRIVTGALFFQDSEGRPQAYFDYGANVIACYGLNYSQKTGRYTFAYLDTKFSGETYERWQFERMLGSAPGLMEYAFTKIAKSSGFDLGNTDKFSLLLNLQKGRKKIGEVYKFEIRRIKEKDKETDKETEQLIIKGFDPDGQFVGSAVVGLTDGFLFREVVTLKLEKEKKPR
mgnify:CR=1 FL=1